MPQGSVLVFLQDKRRIPHYHNNTSTCTPGQSLSDFPPSFAFICVFSIALYNCTFFSDGNGALSILCLLYHLAQCSAHSRSSITHTHTHTHTPHLCNTHTHTHAHTRTHMTMFACSQPCQGVRCFGEQNWELQGYPEVERWRRSTRWNWMGSHLFNKCLLSTYCIRQSSKCRGYRSQQRDQILAFMEWYSRAGRLTNKMSKWNIWHVRKCQVLSGSR